MQWVAYKLVILSVTAAAAGQSMAAGKQGLVVQVPDGYQGRLS